MQYSDPAGIHNGVGSGQEMLTTYGCGEVTDGGDGCGVVTDGGDDSGVVTDGGDGCGVVTDGGDMVVML